MKAIEKDNDYDNFTVGTSPKISIDTRFVMHDTHNSDKSPSRFLPQADHSSNVEIAFEAARRIFERFRPAFPYLEVIRVSFFWNYNLNHGPLIVTSAVMVDPMTNVKVKVEVSERMQRLPKNVDETTATMEEDMLRALVQGLVAAVSKQVGSFRAERAALATTVEHFDSLPLIL